MKLGVIGRLFLLPALLLLFASGCGAARQRQSENELRQAAALQQAGRSAQAIATLERVKTIDPTYAPARTMLAGIYRDKGEYRKAAEEYASLTRLQPKESGNYYNLGLMQQLIGRVEDAAKSYLAALRLRPADAATNTNLGLVYFSLGDTQKSIQYLRRATELDPKSITAWTNLGAALDDAGDLPAGEGCYRRALELEGDKIPVLINYGGNLILQKRANDAVGVLQDAITMNDSALLNKLMGDALALKGWSDAAADRYARATRIDPNYLYAWNALGEVLIEAYVKSLELREPLRERAVDAWARSLSIKPDQPKVRQQYSRWKR